MPDIDSPEVAEIKEVLRSYVEANPTSDEDLGAALRAVEGLIVPKLLEQFEGDDAGLGANIRFYYNN